MGGAVASTRRLLRQLVKNDNYFSNSTSDSGWEGSMKRWSILSAIALFTIFILSACTGGNGETNGGLIQAPPSPTGGQRKIAFFSNRTGADNIYVMSADGSGLENLTNSGSNDVSPAWSPDGKRIAFMSRRDQNFEIYVMNADGSGQERLTNDRGDDLGIAWSPSLSQ